MIKITDKEIIDVVMFNDKAIFVEKVPTMDLNQYKADYFVLNFTTGKKEVITTSAYLMKKFGSAYSKITDTIANYVNCDAAMFDGRSCLTVFSNGQAGMFDSDGNMLWNNELKYNENIVSGLAKDGDCFWTYCTNENCVIRYSTENFKIDLRVGAKDADTFNKPQFVSSDDEFIYVCCSDKIRKIDKSNFTVSDIDKNYTDVKRYYKMGKFAIICKYDGCYIDKDED